MTDYCQFCKKRVSMKRPDGGRWILSPIIEYHGMSYHTACYEKLRAVAKATGGIL